MEVFLVPILEAISDMFGDPIAPSDMMHVVSRKFFSYDQEFYKDKAIYTTKYDGCKGKFIVNYGFCEENSTHYDGTTGLFLDQGLRELYTFNSELFKEFKNVIFQVEIMGVAINYNFDEDEYQPTKNLILVDVVGVKKNGKFYIMFPEDALKLITDKFSVIVNPEKQTQLYKCVTGIKKKDTRKLFNANNFTYFNLYKNTSDLFSTNIETITYRLCKQAETANDRMSFDLFDGYLIILGIKQFKNKIITVDLEVKNNTIIVDDYCTKVNNTIEDGIYEVKYEILNDEKNSTRFKILRRRKDRVFPATTEEIKKFKDDVLYLESNKNKESELLSIIADPTENILNNETIDDILDKVLN